MKNLLKRFAEWGIELGAEVPDIFTSARFRITALYFFSGVFILIAAGFLVDSSITASIQKELQRQFPDSATVVVITSQILSDIRPIVWLIRFGMIVAMAIVAYFLAGITLSPIRHALESQRRFVANASHELRTPITIMKTNSDVALLNEDELAKEDAIKTIKDNLEEIDRMSNTLQILLSFSGYENRISGLLFSRVNLYAVASKVVGLLWPNAEAKGVDLSLSGASLVIVRGNAAALEEMAANLVRNAITYTPTGGSVHVSVGKESGTSSLFTVKDSGIGISPEDLPHIFEPFYRGTNAIAHQKDGRGAGLGLAIVREIAKLHRAKIEIKSDHHIGTTFSVRFTSV